MSADYVFADLWRNPRRTLSTMVGVCLGVGLFCGVLFFVDGLSASMTQRAVAPLPLDMQRIVTARAANALSLEQSVDGPDQLAAGDRLEVTLSMRNPVDVPANEVTVRSRPGPGLRFVAGSARLDGRAITDGQGNPFSSGAAQTGYNLGRLKPGATREIHYAVEATEPGPRRDVAVETTYSTRESVRPVAAGRPPTEALTDLVHQLAQMPGVARANELSIADLGPEAIGAGPETAPNPAKIFGFDEAYARADDTITLTRGDLAEDGLVLSVEAAAQLGVDIGDDVTVRLPDDTSLGLPVTGLADLSRARALFSSRRGGDLETFVYTDTSVVVSPRVFAETVFPAYERAAAAGDGRLKSPPIREVDLRLDREPLAADPATALGETKVIASRVMAVGDDQDYLLDNISNTLGVAADDAVVAKRLFVFLGVPGGLLAAVLAAYAGYVLAEAQRREQAVLRIRGASRRQLLRMLALRVTVITALGAVAGLVVGYAAAVAVLGQASLARASTTSLVTSAAVGTAGGLLATGLALYATGRRSIDRQINEDRARLHEHAPAWQRLRLDLVGVVALAVATVVAIRADAFAGAAGSVYFGRSVQLNLALLLLPVAAWVAGSLLFARLVALALARSRPASRARLGSPTTALTRRSVGRRPWAVASGVLVASLIVALAVALAGFTTSYDSAKVADARYANGADVRITPSPTAASPLRAADAAKLRTSTMTAVTPVVYGLSNVIVRSDRTSDPANLAAVDPASYGEVTRLDSTDRRTLEVLGADPEAVLLSRDMASFLQVAVGDQVTVLLARATDQQVEVSLKVSGLFERLPGFPDGADAVMSLAAHTKRVPTKPPDFFLASTGSDDAALAAAVDDLRTGAGAATQIDTRLTLLDRDQSSLAALNIGGLVGLDSGFALAMAVIAIGIFVFGLLLQRRREYVTLRAQGIEAGTVARLIVAEAAVVALAGTAGGVLVGAIMGSYLVAVLRPLFVLTPVYTLTWTGVVLPVVLVLVATGVSSLLAARLVNGLEATELLRDE